MCGLSLFRENLSPCSYQGHLLLSDKDAGKVEKDQDDDEDIHSFNKMREQNLVRRNGKNSLDSCRMKNFKDYNSQNDFKV